MLFYAIYNNYLLHLSVIATMIRLATLLADSKIMLKNQRNDLKNHENAEHHVSHSSYFKIDIFRHIMHAIHPTFCPSPTK